MASTPMDLDRPSGTTPAAPYLNIHRTIPSGTSSTSNLSDVISTFRPTKLFKRDDIKDGRSQPHIQSIDYDDEGELCMTSSSDETIQIYNVREGRHDKSALSKKYGVKLAKFTHTKSSIIYASTKQNRKSWPKTIWRIPCLPLPLG
jgi:COMPASS component SWD2